MKFMVELREKENGATPRLEYFRNKLSKEFFIISIFSIVILVTAILIKINISDWIYSNVGSNFNYTLVEPINGRSTWYFEIYVDADYYYESYLDAFRSGWNPYKRYTNELDFYVYGPVFIYGLYFTSLLVQLFNPGMPNNILIEESVKWTAINFDALSAVMVYLIIINFKFMRDRKIYKHVLGLIGTFAFIFMPFNLFYIDAYYLNIPQMTFFTLVTFFLIMKKKYRLSAYSLTLAWLTKQMPLFLVIPIFSMIWKEHNLKTAVRRFLRPFLLSTLLLSVPWIFITPILYIGRILAAGRSLWYVTLDSVGNGHGTTLAHSFLYWGAEDLANFYVQINTFMIPFIVFYGFALFIGHFNGKKLADNEKVFTYYITWVVLISHTFISRGLFKYYNAFYTPFFILSIIAIANSITNKVENYIGNRKSEKISSEYDDGNSRDFWNFGIKAIEILSILLLTLGIYYYSWIIMTSIRFLHPFFLFLLTFGISFLIPWGYYRELGTKNKYRELIQDFKDFFKPKFTSILFMLIGVTGVIIQFSVLYLHLFILASGEPIILMICILNIAAMIIGFAAIIMSMFGIHKVLWSICAFCVLAFTLVYPIITVSLSGVFPYISEVYFMLAMKDFIGFWLAVSGSLFSFLFGLLLPKKYNVIHEANLLITKEGKAIKKRKY